MKPFRKVEASRSEYYERKDLNSVHRSSLLVPELPGAETEICLLNHFLLKRGLRDVACRITGIDSAGCRLSSVLFPIIEPRVYVFKLTEIFERMAGSYLVEFFSGSNLFFPFPAVMINHRGPGFISQVHAYNRVLNDVFEDDLINSCAVKESSIDLDFSAGRETFFVFMAGMQACHGPIEIVLETPERKYLQRLTQYMLGQAGYLPTALNWVLIFSHPVPVSDHHVGQIWDNPKRHLTCPLNLLTVYVPALLPDHAPRPI